MAVREIRYSDFDNFAAACNAISNEVSDTFGFVTMSRLLDRFGARIFVRPLLVEGMLASIDSINGGSSAQWAVLVDSEKYNLTESDVVAETSKNPLPFRFRNTIAHELVHSLAFRPLDFGIELRNPATDPTQRGLLVKEIERETEKLSPLLLCPQKALSRLTFGRQKTLHVDEFVRAQVDLGISREVLISRLCLLGPADPLRDCLALRNLAVGIAQWERGGKAMVRKWPLFFNFDRDIVPEPLLKLLSQSDRVPADLIFPDSGFMMCGGTEMFSKIVVNAGTRAVPHAKKMNIETAFESGGWRPGEEFLFTVSGSIVPEPVLSLELTRR